MTNSHSQTENILNYSDGIYMTIDSEWIITYTNQLSANLLGVPAEELIGTDLRESLPDVVSIFYKTLSSTLTNRKLHTITARYGPTQKMLELRAIPTDYGMLAIFHDTTIKEERLKTIRDSEIRHRAILETISGGLVTIGSKGLISSFNHVAEKMFGYQAAEVIGRNVSILMPEKDRQTHEEYTAYSALNETMILNQYRELQGVRKDGSIFPIELNVSPMNVDEHYGYLGIIRDISERKATENKVLEEKNRAEKASQAKSEFLASMSHELHTPLNAIIGFSQLMAMDPGLDSEHKEQIVDIHKAGTYLLTLVEDALNFSKITAGKIDIHTEAVSLESILIECLAMLNPLHKETDIIPLVEPDCNKYVLQADPVRLKQVLTNLLSNAIKYNCENGKVDINCKECGNNQLRITISDTGSGIDNSRLNELFEPFNRLGKECSAIHGTGIGLSITKSLLEAMNGDIGVESTVGKGSEFWIELPLADIPVKK